MAKEILFVAHNHFDPTWRRCFDRPAIYAGVTVRSYAEVEEFCFNEWLRLAPEGYPCSEGQVSVLRKYLERNPQVRRKLRKYVTDGQFSVMLAGEVVQDTNLPSAEGLIRNFLAAMPFYRDFAGDENPGLKFASVEDAFGNSPNYPQVLAGVGAEVVWRTSYRRCPEPVWVGIDGTKLACLDHLPEVSAGGWEKHPPCPACKGKGCKQCGNSGIALVAAFDLAAVRRGLEQAAARPEPVVVFTLATEEVLPDERMVTLVREFNRERKGRCQVRFANPVDAWQHWRKSIEQQVRKRDTTPTPDLNPAMPGCYVTRIRTKQRTRQIAYDLIRAEALLASRSWAAGKPHAPPPAFARAWQLIAFNQFHDAITGTHIDNSYAELMEMLDEAEGIAGTFLPAPAPKAAGPRFKAAGRGVRTKRLGKLDVTFDLTGIHAIRLAGVDVFGTLPLLRVKARPARIAELMLESDFGDAWGQRIPPSGQGVASSSVVPLGDFNERVEIAASAVRWHGSYRGGDRKVKKLAWTVTAKASADGNRLEFVTAVDWNTESRRLRVVVPVAAKDNVATYEVPFGFIDRAWDPGKLDYSQWNANTMEFPALHWVRKSIDDRQGVALLNKGLPCHRWLPGQLDLSLLRSPEWCFCAVEPGLYEFWDIDGQRDTGTHRFEYAIYPYVNGLSAAELTHCGYDYNLGGPLEVPFTVAGQVVVTAWKVAEKGAGWILRLHEAGGQPGEARFEFATPRKVTRTDLLERPRGETVRGRRYLCELRNHEIATFLIR